MESNQLSPDSLGYSKLLRARSFRNNVNIHAWFRGQELLHNFVKVGIGAVGARKGKCRTTRVGFDGTAQLRVCLDLLPLPRQEVPVAPGNFRRAGITFPR